MPEVASTLDEKILTTWAAFDLRKVSGTTPRTRGELVWMWSKDRLRVRFFLIAGNDGRLQPSRPDDAKNLFHSSEYVLVENGLPADVKNGVEGFFKDFGIQSALHRFDN